LRLGQLRENRQDTSTVRHENLQFESTNNVIRESEIRPSPGNHWHREGNWIPFSNIEVNLPLYDEVTGTNPMFHLKQLEQYFDLKQIPSSHQLVIACKSIVVGSTRQWLEAISDTFQNYEQFKEAFTSTWWSHSRQSFLEKCKLYQDKFNPNAGISFSAHFIKYAKTAAYLEPKPTETEVIEAIRYHFPIRIQRILLCTKLDSIGEAVEFLKGLEMLENNIPNQINDGRRHNDNPPASSRGNYYPRTNDRYKEYMSRNPADPEVVTITGHPYSGQTGGTRNKTHQISDLKQTQNAVEKNPGESSRRKEGKTSNRGCSEAHVL
jgi:hypothetical protein